MPSGKPIHSHDWQFMTADSLEEIPNLYFVCICGLIKKVKKKGEIHD